MFPVALNLQTIRVLLVGKGELLEKRLAYLDEDKAQYIRVFSDNASESLQKAAGDRLVPRLPNDDDIASARVVLVAGLPRDEAEKIARRVRDAGRLVNVEDINDLCDFYFTANVRRGDLVIAVSTSGASPTLARKARDAIARLFGPEWEERTRILAELRLALKAKGAGFKEVIDATEAKLKNEGWLRDDSEAA
jgi:precorrin-2 dehydrogenase / sirohydrochlorin ferrochelatase